MTRRNANRTQLVVIADDLTGAMDTAGQFAKMGFTAKLVFDAGKSARAQVLAYTTDSRDAPVEGAAEKVKAVAARHGGITLYKKIDSTLRGHIGVELAAALEGTRCRWALVAPAFPDQGRSTLNGIQRVDGTPVTEVAEGGRVVYPVLSAHIPTLLNAQTSLPVRCMGLEWSEAGPEILAGEISKTHQPLLVLDALSDGHLAAIARAARLLSGQVLLCGSAGLAAALARIWSETPGIPSSKSNREWKLRSPLLFVIGSRNPVTARQVQALLDSCKDVELVTADAGQLLAGKIGEAAAALGARLAGGRHAALRLAGSALGDRAALALSQALGMVVKEALAQGRPAALLATGGGTARAVCRGLQATRLELLGEVSPGVPWSRIEGGLVPGLILITKAGGLGPEDILPRLLEC